MIKRNSGMLQLLSLVALGGMMLSDYPTSSIHKVFEALTDEEHSELLKRSKERYKRLLLSKPGVATFRINGFEFIARDEKNAQRKYENLMKELKKIEQLQTLDDSQM